MMGSVFERAGNIVGRRENTAYVVFSLSLMMISKAFRIVKICLVKRSLVLFHLHFSNELAIGTMGLQLHVSMKNDRELLVACLSL